MSKLLLTAIAVAALGAVAYSETAKKSRDEKSSAPSGNAKAAGDAAAKADLLDPNKVDLDKVDPEKVDWSKVDWKKRLTREQYNVTRQAGTERPFKNEYFGKFDDGVYRCSNCGLPLFESTAKFDSHCGWPSFDKPIGDNAVIEKVDDSLGMQRTEIRCRRCGAHLGHVFDDGPTATGLRYCMNSASMKFIPAKSQKPKTAGEVASAAASPSPASDSPKADASDHVESPAAK